MTISIERAPSAEVLEKLGVSSWPIWSKEVSTFSWKYESREVCYVLEGAVEVTPQGGAPVRLGPGDLAAFPEGMACTWRVLEPVRKRYRFD